MWQPCMRIGQPIGHHRVDERAVAHAQAPAGAFEDVRRVAHGLGATGNDQRRVAGANGLRRVDDGLQPGSADAIDRLGGNGHGQSRLDRRLTGDVHAGAPLQDASHHDIVDIRGRYGRTRHCRLDDHRSQVHGRQAGKTATEAADCRPARTQNDRIHHCASSSRLRKRSSASGLASASRFFTSRP